MHNEINKYPYEPQDPWTKIPKTTPWKNPAHKGVDIPRVTTIADVFPRLDRLTIGWSPILDQLKELTANKPSYPPYDIVELEEGVNLLNVAVAGFRKEDISVTLQEAVLTIVGKRTEKPKGEIVYQGIAGRDFKLELAVAEYWEITSAKLEDGMLTIQFNKELPEEKKPKVIDIQ